ncbi:MAG: Uncharacterized protein XE12_1155, partial [Synergistales bacterium 54_9]
MSLETVLLLFDRKRPFWTAELLELAGEDPSTADGLEKKGLILRRDGGFVLSDAGRERFKQWAAESWLDTEPAQDPMDTD